MQRHQDQGGCENFDGEPHTKAQCKAMAARINRVIDWTKANMAGDEHGTHAHYHVTSLQGTVHVVSMFTGTIERAAQRSATAPTKGLDTDTIEDLRIVAASEPSQWMQNYAPGMAATLRMNAERARALLREHGVQV